jgi:hypothetical protein
MPVTSDHDREVIPMAPAVPRQHPAVVLRSHFVLVRRLLAAAMVAVVALAIAVAILAAAQ